VNPTSLEQEGVQTGDATFADDGTEQDALAEYLLDNFLNTPFAQLDTGRDLDERIQNLNFRADSIFGDSDNGGEEPTDPVVGLTLLGTYETGVPLTKGRPRLMPSIQTAIACLSSTPTR
jgi:2',3'-cyclic-nucleotide 2'-phosphodiesterase/3'-nucleotidase/5'-nucleotidase